MIHSMNLDDLQTGDIILISDYKPGLFGLFLSMIRYGTHSEYVHVGMIIKDPTFLEKPLQGTYIWESSYEGTPDPQDGKIKLGIQLTSLQTFKNNYSDAQFYVRRLEDNSIFTDKFLKQIHDKVYNVPYDINPLDWILAFFKKDIHPQKVTRFWCSAFVGYILTRCGVLKKNNDWSIMYPSDFALDGENLEYTDINKNKFCSYEYKINL